MNALTVIGLLAALCTTAAFVPQVIQAWQTRETRGISLGMYLTFTVGLSLWLLYGILLRDLPIIVANAVTLLLAATVIRLKLRHG